MKKRLLLLALILAAVVSVFAIGAIAAEDEPALKIEAANLEFADSVYLWYAVSHEGIDAADMKMLFYTEPKSEYTAENANYYAPLYEDGAAVAGKEGCAIFRNTALRAKNMADNIYAVAYANADGEEYYSAPVKYSILQYAYNKLGKTGTASENEALKSALSAMLNYGASIQVYTDYKTDRLANADFYQVKVEDGVLADGFTKGLFLAGEIISLSAPAEKDGASFAAWVNADGETVATTAAAEITVAAENEVYTATYKAPQYSEGLAFISSPSGDGTCCVSGIGTCTDTDLVIPPISPDGDSVVSINASAFKGCATLTSVNIPDSVTSIGEYAFYNCVALTSVNIPSSVTSIWRSAFSGSSKLTSVTITDIAAWCNISFTDAYANPLFYAHNLYLTKSGETELVTELVIPDDVAAIGKFAFFNCSSLTSVTIPDSVTSIGKSAFNMCQSLVNVNIGNSVEYLSDYAFYGCQSLTDVKLPNTVTSIGEYVFYDCRSLASINIPASTTALGKYAFYGCQNLISVNVPDAVTSIGDYTFYDCQRLANVNIPDSATSIGKYAFYGCKSLTSVIIPSSMASIGSSAFYGCSKLTSVIIADIANWCDIVFDGYYANPLVLANIYHIKDGAAERITDLIIPEGVTSIGDYAFSDCSELTSVTIPNSVTSIGESAFCDCFGLTSLNIPASVTSIGNSAFAGCSGLTGVSIPNSVTFIDNYAFKNCSGLTSVNIPSSFSSISLGLFYNCTELKSITIPVGVTSIGDIAFSGCSTLTAVSIPNTVTSIGKGAFERCRLLTSVNIPDSVTSINERTFDGCYSLTSVIIPDSVTSIGLGAFSNCSELTSVTFGSSVTSIGVGAFRGTGLTSLSIPDSVTSIERLAFAYCSYLTRVYIPDSVTTISAETFYNCFSITSVTIPDTVTSIGDMAFYNCTKLISIFYTGTSAEWSAITVGTYNDSLTSATQYYFSEEAPTAEGNYWHYDENGEIEIWPEYVAPKYSEGLAFTSNGDGTCYVSGIGTCTDTDLVIPPTSPDGDSVTSIRYGTFFYCTSLTSVTIPDSVTSIGNQAFAVCESLTSVTIPDSVTSIGAYAFSDCRSLTSVTFGENSQLQTIGDLAFYRCYNLTSVTIPDTVTSIGEWAFSICKSLTSVTIPDSVTSIGEYAFFNCTSLTSIIVTDGNTAYQSIDGNLYTKDGSVLVQYAIGKQDAHFIIPDSVTSIGYGAFADCDSLTSVTIPDSVTSIGDQAFRYCTSLTSVYYEGTAEEWSAITVGTHNDPLTSATRYYYSEEAPTEEGNYWHYGENGEILIWE